MEFSSLEMPILWLFRGEQCCNCTTATVASVWCDKCHGCYCSTCCQSVHQIIALARHRKMSLSMKPPDPVLCSTHPDEKLKYWCYNHEIAICRDCLHFEHREDKCVPLDRVTKDVSVKVNAYSLVFIHETFSI
jgi:B-box zinc finger